MVYNPDIWVADGPTYTTEGQAAITQIETASGETLTTAERVAVNRFVRSQVLNSNWSKVREFVFGHFSTENKSKIGWKGVRNCLPVGSPTWAQATGWTTNGTSSYLNSQFVPSTDGGTEFTLNDSLVGCSVISGANGPLFGCIGSGGATNQIFFTTNANSNGNHLYRMYVSLSSSNVNTNTISGTGTRRTYSLYRYSSAAHGYRINGGAPVAVSQASSALPNRAIYFGARNNNGTADQFGAITFDGYWMTSAVDFDHTVWEEALRNLIHELGGSTRVQPIYKVGWEYNRYKVKSNDALLFWLGGQSNQNNYTTFTLEYGLTATNSNAKIWNPTAVAFQNLIPATNSNPVDNTKRGIIERYARTLSLYFPGQVYFLMFAKSATGIKLNGAADDWNIASAGDLYVQFINNHLLPAISNLIAAGKRPIFKGIDWDQGENEAANDASTYQTDLVAMINGVINNAYTNGADCRQLIVLFKRLHNGTTALWANQTTVRNIHTTVAEGLQPLLTTHACIRKSDWYNTDQDGDFYRYEESPNPVHYDQQTADRLAFARANYHAQFLR